MLNKSDVSTWTEEDYDQALAEVGAKFPATAEDPERERITFLCGLIYEYEAVH